MSLPLLGRPTRPESTLRVTRAEGERSSGAVNEGEAGIGGDHDMAGDCLTCEGRGWKFVTSRADGLWGECPEGLVARSCVDCGGLGVLRRG
jgi:hypothetical protein